MLLTHRCKDGIRIVRIFVCFRPVSICKVREYPLRQRLDRKLLQIIIRVAGIRIDTLLIREDRNREDRRTMMLADTFDAGVQKPDRDEATFGRSVATEVERGKGTSVLSSRLFILDFWSSRSYFVRSKRRYDWFVPAQFSICFLPDKPAAGHSWRDYILVTGSPSMRYDAVALEFDGYHGVILIRL